MSEIIKAVVAAQKEIIPPVKDKINPRFKSGYSSLDAIYNSIRGPLTRNGLWLSHSVETIDGKSFLVTTIRHISGEELSNKIPMFIENQTSQGFASALTYACRYATCRMFSLSSDEDDDGEASDQDRKEEARELAQEIKDGRPLSEKQRKWLKEIGEKNEQKLGAVFRKFSVSGMEALLSREFAGTEFMDTINYLEGTKK